MPLELPENPTFRVREDDIVPSSNGAWLAIFDHDGVLVDTLKLHQSAWLEYGRRSGLSITADFIHQTFGMTNPSILRLLAGEAMSEVEIARHSAHKEECYREIAEGKIALMDGVREVLDALTDCGVRLAIGSSGGRANLERPVRGDRRARRHHARQARPPGLPRRLGPFGHRAGPFDRLRGRPRRHPGRQGRGHVRSRTDDLSSGPGALGRGCRRGGRKPGRVRCARPDRQDQGPPPMTGKSPVSPVLPGSIPDSRKTTRRISLASMGVAFFPASRTSW